MNMENVNHVNFSLAEERPLRELVSSTLRVWLDKCSNPVEDDSEYRATFLAGLARSQVCELQDLMAADQVMDAIIVPGLHASAAVLSLQQKVQSYLERYPQLLETGWTHAEGYVFNLMERLKAKRDTAASSGIAVVTAEDI